MNLAELKPDDQRKYLKLKRLDLLRRARSNLLDFTRFTFPGTFDVNWHHRLIASKLDQVVRGEIRRLMIWTPPRHGKTELASRRLPAYAFGLNPNEQIIAASYAHDLASRNNRDVQRIIDSSKYSWVFPETKLSGKNIKTVAHGSWLRNADIFEIVEKHGSYRGTGVDGGITGMGFTLGLIDDPYKGWKEANSPTVRQTVWNWWETDFMTRASSDARIVIIMTRWHEDDLCGRLLKKAKVNQEAEQWEVVRLPAIAEAKRDEYDVRNEGEALWDGRFPIITLNQRRGGMSEKNWNGLYQQRPAPQEGGIVKRVHLVNRFKLADIPEEAKWIQTWDTNAGEETEKGSFVVGQVWAAHQAMRWLIHQYRRRTGTEKTLFAIMELLKMFPKAKTIYIEKKAAGGSTINLLKKKIPGIIPVTPVGSKVDRLDAVSHYFEGGNIWLPENVPWVPEYIEELVTFPNAPNDDQVDATSQGLLKLDKRVDLDKVAPISFERRSPFL